MQAQPTATISPEIIARADAHIKSGIEHQKKGETDKALAEFDAAIKVNPSSALAYYNRGVVYADKKDADRAFADFDMAVQLDPQMFIAYVNRGIIYGTKGDYDRAIADFDKALSIKPTGTAYLYRGRAYELKGNLDKAIDDYDEARQYEDASNEAEDALFNAMLKKRATNPDEKLDSADAYKERAWAHESRGDYQRAILDYTEVIKLEPDDVWAFVGRARAYLKVNDKDKAIVDYKEAIKLINDPSSSLQEELLQELRELGVEP